MKFHLFSLTSFWAAVSAAACLAIAACNGASNGIGGGDGGAEASNGNCSTVTCTANASTPFQLCQLPPVNGCDQSTYNVGSQSFPCNSCQGCATAEAQAQVACAGPPDAGGNCASAVACGTAGTTYQECTTLGPNNACVSIDYKTSDGHNFTCPGCANCASIAENLQTYCSSNPSPDAGTGMTSCSTAVSCGNTGTTYEECTTAGAGGVCDAITYKVSNGTSFKCSSCSDCTAALQSLEAFCSGAATTNCTAAETCGTSALTYQQCTTSLSGTCESIYYQTSDGDTFACNSCSDCTAALSSMESYCASMVNPVTSCSADAACGTTGVTYELCTTTSGGTCTGEYYTTTDGNTFTCTGCDCTTASSQLTTYCASLSSACDPACTGSQICCSCTGTLECIGTSGDTCSDFGCQTP
jgi:hypothetical protein